MWKPMLPSLSEEVPKGKEWTYEVKYDGFRVLLKWTKDGIEIWSRNGNDLTAKFPEIVAYCEENMKEVESHLPLVLDGELVVLNTAFQANFSLLQIRNRLKDKDRIHRTSLERPVTLMCFDLILHKGENITGETYVNRRKLLNILPFPHGGRMQVIQSYESVDEIWSTIFLHLGEGLVAKRKKSKYAEGERTNQWVKVKNWRVVSGILSTYNPDNGYFSVDVYKSGDNLVELGKFKHGLGSDDQKTLTDFFTSKGKKTNKIYTLEPAACVDVKCLQVQKDDLREPMFGEFRFDLSPESCTVDKTNWDLALFPDVDITNVDKVLWKKKGYRKRELLLYLRNIAPYMMPFLQEKRLTVIRFPDGIYEESFFQKHLPDYAPGFVDYLEENGEKFQMCNNLSSLIWLGNQGAIEYHIPFETIHSDYPNEIVLDLDPPSIDAFHLAVYAAQLIKKICDKLDLLAFVKTSGGKGMQVHIPIPAKSLTYEETRRFTEKIVNLLVQQEPSLFTTERLKKNRGERLYLDYVQHAEGKTIIAPYSLRGKEEATVATPLFWNEVTEDLHPTQFTIETVLDRVEEKGCPFYPYHLTGKTQNIDQLRRLIAKEKDGGN